MDASFCPGAKALRQPKPEFFSCPKCGEEVEIWTDEIKRNCSLCGTAVFRNQKMSCVQWCSYAEECVGRKTLTEYMENQKVSIKNILIKEIKKYFSEKTGCIEESLSALREGENLLSERSGDWHIVIPACIIHKIENRKVRKKILLKSGLRETQADQICSIIDGLFDSKGIMENNMKIVHDATLYGKKQS